ncbi:probable G-protein coupled receptor 179 [Sorex fumeus]|uniref:probable G-protein coupled receptor 179 n=1 Tax=Sorex fumeus TaxID=62283 RepID=UPI0024AD5A12|nr:probable G-protein coupled receptor 179 [Sorex fumeus]
MGTTAVVLPAPVWGLLSCCFLCSWAWRGPRPLSSLPAPAPQVQPGSVPSWGAPERAEAALAFLYSGDAQQLLGANCSQRYVAWRAGGSPGLPPLLQRAAGILAQAANFLNMLLQANDIRESSVEEDVEWYQALVRSLAEGDPRTYRVLLTFNPPPGASHLTLALQATRSGDETILEDLSQTRMQERVPAGAPDSPALRKRVLTNDLGSLGSPKWPRGDGYVGDVQHVRLTAPFLECQGGQLRPGWLVTLSATFYGLKPDLSPEARGQVQMDLDLQSVDINQCSRGPGWFSDTHLCDLNSTQCVPLKMQGFVLSRYLCRCRPGFYGVNLSAGLEEPVVQVASPPDNSGQLLRCLPCAQDCASCLDAAPCLEEEASALRAAVLACQACCMLAVFLGMVVSYRGRRSKKVRAAGLVLLEAVLFGSLLLYFPVFILYFRPSVFRCIALRWVRLLGFVTVYGSITLRLHRVLQLFLSPTAQRGPVLSRGRLVWRLALLLLVALTFLAVWTAGVLEPGSQHTALITRGHTPAGRHFYLCHHDRWDYIMVVAEVLLLCWGSFLCYATRAVPSAFHEPRYLGIALHNELLLSTAFHATRFVLGPSLHPDWTLLLFFLHTHGTVTATLALIFIPKLRRPGAPSREEMVDEELEDELDLQHSGSYLDSSLASAWSERSLDPGDIRDELKKLYAQLEVHKTKEMATNNPHLPKTRDSSRQGLGRSFMRCLAEFPEVLARQHSRSSGRGSLPNSSRRRLLSEGLQETQGSPALRRSRGTHEQEPGGEQGPPLLDSLLRRKLAMKDSRRSRASAEGPPALGFRSASAHNLTVSERSPRARPASLQKSLSVVTGTQEKELLVASQAQLEEMYQQAKEQEERRRAEGAGASPARRPSTRRPEPARRAPLSAPPTPAKNWSVDCLQGTCREDPGKRPPHPLIRPQVSMPSRGEPQWLSPTATWAPAPMLAPGPPESPSLLTYICPWENAELPIKKEKTSPEDPLEVARHTLSPAPARARLWRALSVAAERKAAAESRPNPEDGLLQGDSEDGDEERPKIFSKSHSLRSPAQPGSVRGLGLALRVLTRSRSTYREKESGPERPEQEEGVRASGEGARAGPRSPRQGRPKAVSKQAAVVPTDEESLQNQQNAHTSRRLRQYQRASGDRDGGGGPGQGVWRGVITGPAGSSLERAAGPGGWQEVPRAGLQPQGSAQHSLAEVCPWEVPEVAEPRQPQGESRADICPWEGQEGGPEGDPGSQAWKDAQEAEEGASGKPEPHRDVGAPAPKGLMGQGTVCPWDHVDPGGLSPRFAPDRSQGRCVAVGRGETRQAGRGGREAWIPDLPVAEHWVWGAGTGEEGGRSPQEGVKELSQEKQEPSQSVSSWKGRSQRGDTEPPYPQETTDFRGPSAVSPGGCSGSPAVGASELCPWELTDKVVARGRPSRGAGGGCILETEGFGEMGLQVGEPAQEPLLQQESGCPRETTVPGSAGPRLDSAWSKAEAFGKLTGETAQVAASMPGEAEAAMGAVPEKPGEGGPKAHLGELDHEGCRPAGMCPWAEGDAPTGGNAQLCPWELAESIPGKGGPREGGNWESGKAPEEPEPRVQEEPERVVREQEAMGARKSQDWGRLSPPTALTYASEAVGSVGACTARACPWEAEGVPFAKKAEVGPQEGRGGAESGRMEEEGGTASPGGTSLYKVAATAEAGEHFAEAAAKPSGGQQAAYPWEGAGFRGPLQEPDAQGTDQQEVGPYRARGLGSKMAELCRWEITDPEGNSVRGSMVDICFWEGAGPSQEEPDLLASAASQTEILPLPASEKPLCLLAHRPPASAFPESKSSFPAVSKPASPMTVQVEREHPGPPELEPKTSLAPQLTLQDAQARQAPPLPEDQGQVASKSQHKESESPCE